MFGFFFRALDFRFWLNGGATVAAIASVTIGFSASSAAPDSTAGTAAARSAGRGGEGQADAVE